MSCQFSHTIAQSATLNNTARCHVGPKYPQQPVTPNRPSKPVSRSLHASTFAQTHPPPVARPQRVRVRTVASQATPSPPPPTSGTHARAHPYYTPVITQMQSIKERAALCQRNPTQIEFDVREISPFTRSTTCACNCSATPPPPPINPHHRARALTATIDEIGRV